jgi:dihydrofolate synthase / folylpolyglutamate synthase
VFVEKAKELRSPIEFASKNFKVTNYTSNESKLNVTVLNKKSNESKIYELDLSGTYQLKNILGVVAAMKIISESGFLISEENIREGFKNVTRLTGLQGRWQTLSEKPLVICDAGHNEDGIKEVLQNINSVSFKQLHFVLGVVNDKDISSILKLLPKDALYYFTRASVPRALSETELKQQAEELGLKGSSFSNVKVALEAAKKKAKTSDLIFIGGSMFVVADALQE